MKNNIQFEYAGGYVYGRGFINKQDKTLAALRLDYCLEALREKSGKVLEIGCGGGKLSRSIKKYRPDLEVFGADICKKAISENVKLSDGVEYLVSDVLFLPHPKETFDAVLMFDTLEHFEKIDCVLKEVRRVLKKDGIFHIYVPCEKNPFTIYWLLGNGLKKRHGGHIQYFNKREIMGFIKSNSFLIENVRHSDYLLTQFFDFSFFLSLELVKNKSILWQAHGNNDKNNTQSGFVIKALGLIKDFISFLTFYENTFFNIDFFSMGMHLSCRKKI